MTDEKRHSDPAHGRERIGAYLQRTGLSGPRARVVPLTGDASDRRYFRVIQPNEPSIVLALHAQPFDFGTLPFVNVAGLLRRIELPIPEILGHADDLGILALQDLGDVTLQAHLGAASAAEHAALYRHAVVLIELLQRRGREFAGGPYLPYGIAFDVDKLTWELDFFVKHFVEAYRGVTLAEAARQAIREECRPIVDELAAEDRVLCHRDYHSRNIMVHEGHLYVIDFQDARMGPDTYDLVSLLRDSYVDLPEQSVDDLVAYFLALRGGQGGPGPDESVRLEYRRRFDLMALQRNLKALGTFGYQTATRGNTVYIQYIPRTLRHARINLERYPRFDRLRQLLSDHIDELR